MFDSEPCDWLFLPLQLPTPTTQFSLDHKQRSRKRNRKKWKRSDCSDYDSVGFSRSDHGIGITENELGTFVYLTQHEYDFGDDGSPYPTSSYSLNVWIR